MRNVTLGHAFLLNVVLILGVVLSFAVLQARARDGVRQAGIDVLLLDVVLILSVVCLLLFLLLIMLFFW